MLLALRHAHIVAMEEADDQRPSSASAPQLPPLSPAASQGRMSATVRDFKTQALEKQMAAREKRMRAAQEAPVRQQFLQGLLNQDLQQVSKWHGSRPHHEQKRFVKAVDSLYKGFSKIEGALPKAQAQIKAEDKIALAQEAALNEELRQLAARDDPYLRESPRGVMSQSQSAPTLSKPIEVFEQNKRKGRGRGDGAEGSDAGSMRSSQPSLNGLEKWMECMSNTTLTTNASSMTEMTSLSQMTRTSSGCSDYSDPGTTNQMIYRVHKRALAANKRSFNAKDQHKPAYLKDGIPNIGFPECERMATQFRDAYGHKPIGGDGVPKEAYASVFRDQSLPYVAEFLDIAPKEEKKQVAGMVRSLNYLRLAHHRNTSCVMRQEMDLAENSRLWKPKKVTQVFAPEQRNFSRVPLGAPIITGQSRVKEDTPPPSRSGESIHSPSVSNLGSLPLTPRSLATPLAVGKDLPFPMSQPEIEQLPSIAEVA